MERRRRPHLLSLALALLAALMLAACGSADEDAQSDGDAMAEDAAPAEEEAADDGGSGEAADRAVVTNAAASVLVDEPVEAAAELVDDVEGHGGHVEDRRERTEDEETVEATLTLRIPAEDLGTVMDSLDELGEVIDRSQSSEDVTGTVRDLDARIEALETSTERLQEIMEEADGSAELLEAEEVLSERQASLESLQAERQDLGDQVEMSTLEVELTAQESVGEVEADGFTGGLTSGWNAMLTFFNVLLVVTGALLPWLLLLGVPAALLIWLLRRRIRTRRTAEVPPAGAPGNAVETAPLPPADDGSRREPAGPGESGGSVPSDPPSPDADGPGPQPDEGQTRPDEGPPSR